MTANVKDNAAPQDLAELVSSNLKKLIVQNDITQKELADMIGAYRLMPIIPVIICAIINGLFFSSVILYSA